LSNDVHTFCDVEEGGYLKERGIKSLQYVVRSGCSIFKVCIEHLYPSVGTGFLEGQLPRRVVGQPRRKGLQESESEGDKH
jgi:hypothetical protein